MNEKPHYIYGLTEPESDVIRYVGYTCDPYRRLCQHNSNGGYPGQDLSRWLRKLKSEKKEPQMVILDRVNGKADALRVENDWILALRAGNVPLTNRRYPGHPGWYHPTRK